MHFLILFFCASVSLFAESIPATQLPPGVKPLAYELAFQINPRKQSFSGKAKIKLQLDQKTKQFWMHGQNLKIQKAELRSAGHTQTVTYQQVSPEGLVLIQFEKYLEPGEASLSIDYQADFQKDLSGLYVVSQNKYSYAYSQFEPIVARTCFPSFDEPR